jgi:hypothetical protein
MSTSALLMGGRSPVTLLPLASCQEAGGTMCVVTFLSLDAEQRTLFRRRQMAKVQAGLASNAYLLHCFTVTPAYRTGATLAHSITSCKAPLRTSVQRHVMYLVHNPACDRAVPKKSRKHALHGYDKCCTPFECITGLMRAMGV